MPTNPKTQARLRQALYGVTKWLEEYAGDVEPQDSSAVRAAIEEARAAMEEGSNG